MSEQRVTTLITNFNYSQWVERCLDSAAASDYRPLRICFVDDGSTDDSVDRVLRHVRETKPYDGPEGIQGVDGVWKSTGVPVRVIACEPARGPSAGRNVGIRACRPDTDWWQVLDADDELYPHKISTLLDAAASMGLEDVGFVYGDYDTVDENGVLLRNYKPPFSRQELMRECVVHSGSLVSARWLDVAGGYDENLRAAEDWDLWIRLSEMSLGLHVPESLTLVRVGSHNSTATVPSATWQACWQKVAEKTRQRGVGLSRVRA